MDFAEMDDLGEFGEFGDPTDLNDVPNEHNYPISNNVFANHSGISNASVSNSIHMPMQQRDQMENQLKMR